jgi:predicted nucleotidyltransferase
MATVTAETESLRAAIAAHRSALDDVLHRYGASNPRLFGSVARGDATASSDIDLLVDLDPAGGNPLLRIAGIGEEFSRILETRVDVAASSLLRDAVSMTAHADAVAL